VERFRSGEVSEWRGFGVERFRSGEVSEWRGFGVERFRSGEAEESPFGGWYVDDFSVRCVDARSQSKRMARG
jgi:hypothetical protein